MKLACVFEIDLQRHSQLVQLAVNCFVFDYRMESAAKTRAGSQFAFAWRVAEERYAENRYARSENTKWLHR